MTNISVASDSIRFDLRLTLRILVVTDGAINLWEKPSEPQRTPTDGFTLREMARALWEAPRSRYPYTAFQIDHAIHGNGPFKKVSRSESDSEYLPARTRQWTQYNFFKFDDQRDLVKQYDQLWFFGYWPGNPVKGTNPELFDIPSYRTALSSDELRVIFAFMNAGGGVFATGDHGLLGTYLCGEIPRVRKMRRWKNSVPSLGQSDRVDTIVPVTMNGGRWTVDFDDQSDDTPKPLILRRYALWNGLIHLQQQSRIAHIDVTRTTPHPVLCTPSGPINSLPDHMHEGLLYEDDDVELDESYEGKKEFPGGQNRPAPEVIAWSKVRGGNVYYDDDGFSKTVVGRTVPTISVYDGQQVGVGRVVVDSTFHHWLDINLRGYGASGKTGLLGPHLELAHNYIRNIAQWLATSTQRQSMRDGLFVHVIANSGGWSGLIHDTLLIGEHAANVLGEFVSACDLDGMVFSPWLDNVTSSSADNLAGALAVPSKESVRHYVLGAMTEKGFELIGRLPAQTEHTKDRQGSTLKEFEMISTQLGAARSAGVSAMCKQWQSSLNSTAAFLEHVVRSVGTPGADTSVVAARRNTEVNPPRGQRKKR